MTNSTSTGVELLVVGGGIAGLTFAISAQLLGFSIRIVEKRQSFDDFEAPYTSDNGDVEGIAVHRNEFHRVLYEYASEIGLEIEFGKTILRYFEDVHKGSVLLADGTMIAADIVVAADGVGSSSWELVLEEKAHAVSSGFAVYRSGFPTAVGLENPIIKQFDESLGGEGWVVGFIGPNAHIVISRSQTKIGWLLTHKDTKDATEDWDALASVDDVLPWITGWNEFVTEIIHVSAAYKITDWKLMWRDPQSKWSSPLARVVQIGDAAHSFLPTSGYGASMAMEDAYSLCQCIQREQKARLPLAVQVHNILRFERVSCAQKVGFKNREVFHKTDWAAVSINPKILRRNWAPWLLDHDPEAYTELQYDACVKHILEKSPFKNTNSVPGYEYKSWTVQGFLEASEAGELPEDAGEWY
ncbi:hypothetical protein TruAng_007186 [Truncatella angustata]|nr:hypothetical protein TruAng_007186 [Truncatella angustata]